jgi:hypothetical protein
MLTGKACRFWPRWPQQRKSTPKDAFLKRSNKLPKILFLLRRLQAGWQYNAFDGGLGQLEEHIGVVDHAGE